MRGILLTICVALGITAVVVWAAGLMTGTTEGKTAKKTGGTARKRSELGNRLYQGPPIDLRPFLNKDLSADPIMISECHLSDIERLPVTSQVDGTLLFIGERMDDPTSPPTQNWTDQIYRAKIYQAGTETYYKYHRLRENEFVQLDQMVALIDPTVPLNQVAIKYSKWEASQAEYKGAYALQVVYGREVERLDTLRARRRDLVSDSEYEIAKAQRDKYTYEAFSKKEAIKVAKNELVDAETLVKLYTLRNSIDPQDTVKTKYKNSIIKTILKMPGEAVKKGDPIMEIHYIGRLRAEGLADVQHLGDIHEGMEAEVYPAQRREPIKTFLGPRSAINGVAVSKDTQDPYIISASEDKTARVWQRSRQGERITWHHPSAVKSVACTAPGSAKNYCLTGCADGSIRLWDLDNLSPEPVKEWSPHNEAINCLAFSPDGKWFATGSEDNIINLYETAGGKKPKYTFEPEDGHLSAVTALHFTPDLQLVSAGRDNTLRVWTLFDKGARLNADRPIEDRSGSVAHLGVSRDGKYMLFDQGKTLQVMSLKEGRTIGVIQDPSAASPFETLAEFSPDGSLILTASASDGRLQLWRAPTGRARSYEVRQFMPKDGSPATCAAFGKDSSLATLAQLDRDGKPGTRDAHDTFVVTGTKDGLIHLWAIPSPELVNKTLRGKVSLRDRHIEPSSRQGRVWVDVGNEDGQLTPGETATVVIPREARGPKK